jgi:hypothetical protein
MVSGPAADCERILGGFFGQPVNTLTCAGFLVGALLIWQRRRDPVMTSMVAAVGLGSIAFHGPMPPGGEYLHDLSIVGVLTWIGLVELGKQEWWPLALPVAGLAAVAPVVADPSQGLLAGGVILLQLRAAQRRRLRLLTVGLLAAGGLVGTLSRTGGPLCNPDAWWQGHGFWHLAAAGSLTLWALKVQDPSARSGTPSELEPAVARRSSPTR